MAIVNLETEKRSAMQPLTPDDLLIRTSTAEHDQMEEKAGVEDSPVVLERFQSLEKVIRDIPLTVDPYLELAEIYIKSTRWLDAKRVLEKAIERFPENEKANFLFEEAQLARSVQLLQDAQQLHESQPTKLTDKSLQRCLLELNVLREKVYRGRLGRHPDQIGLNIPLAVALENLGQRKEAIACLESAVVVPEFRSEAAYHLGQLYERAGEVTKALSLYRRAAMFRVPLPSVDARLRALAAAANLAQKSKMIDSAKRYLQMLVELQPENAVLKKRLSEIEATPL